MENFAFKGVLRPEHYLFPHISSRGACRSDVQMSRDGVQKVVNEFSKGAGIDIKYTTHCFRRGGAKYRFMLCIPGLRWPLHVVSWWGSWAGESVSSFGHNCKYVYL